MARLRTQHRGLIEWFELGAAFDVGPAAVGSARLLENPLGGPVMRVALARGGWKVLAFPGTGYDVTVDDEAVQAGAPRTVVYGSSIKIRRDGVVRFDATFEDVDELERRAASLAQDLRTLAEQLAARDLQLEASSAQLARLQQQLVAEQAHKKHLERTSQEYQQLSREYEQLHEDYGRVTAECSRLRKDRDDARLTYDHQDREIRQLQSRCASLEELYRVTHDNAAAQMDYYLQKAEDVKQRYAELQRERDDILAKYNECARAMETLVEAGVDDVVITRP